MKKVKALACAIGASLAATTQTFATGIELNPSDWLPNFSIGDDPSQTTASDAILRFRDIGLFVSGAATVTCIVFFLYSVMRLTGAGDNEMARKRAIAGLATSGAGVVLMGGLTAYLAILHGFLRV